MSDPRMTSYTFRYFKGDRFVSMNNLNAESDEEAIVLLKEMRFGFDVEVWDDGRFIFGTDASAPRKK